MQLLGPLHTYGASVNMEDRNRMTPLHEAAKAGSTTTVKGLLDLGATEHPQNRLGKTPLDLAQLRHKGVVELLGGRFKKKGFFGR